MQLPTPSAASTSNSITKRIRRVILTVTGTSLLLASIAFVLADIIDFRRSLQQNIATMGKVTAHNSVGAMAFSDTDAAQAILHSLRSYPHIQFAGLYDAEGKIFETTTPNATDLTNIESAAYTEFRDDILEVFQPIIQGDGEIIGFLLLIVDTEEQNSRLVRLLFIISGIMLICGLIATALARKLPYPIISVLDNLVEVFDRVATTKDFTQQTIETDITEFNSLVTGFNTMLSNLAEADYRLRKSEERLALALQGSGEGLWDLDLSKSQAFYDHQSHKILGYPMGTLNREMEYWVSLIHDEDVARANDALQQHLANKTAEYTVEYRVKTASNEWLWLSVHGKVVEWSHDQPTRISGIMLDITDRHKADEERCLLTAIFKNTYEPVIVFDKELFINAVNTAFVELTKQKDEYLMGSNLSSLLLSHQDSEYFSIIRKALHKTNHWEGEIRVEGGNNGDVFNFWFTISPVGDVTRTGDKQSFLGTFSDVLQRQKVEDELRYLANYDPLTNLPNRRMFEDRINHALNLAERNNSVLAVIFVDLDRFKQINDSLGHSVGDALLSQVAERLAEPIRASDTLARLGGDEFTLLLENINCKELVAKVADKLIGQFEKSITVQEYDIKTSASIGIALYPDDGTTVDMLMKNADAAMYAAKNIGRNNYQFYQPVMNERAKERLALENDLFKALDQGELFLVYQPKIELSTGKIIGVEALIRWHHPEIGLISPVQFIPISEESGLIIPIGEWVLETACKKLVQWQQIGLTDFSIAVNVSGKQFQSVDLPALVQRILNETGLDPQYLELELTESLLMETGEKAIQTLRELKDLGIHLSIDDFGTGYSSLQYLSKFPIDLLKIDRSFIMGIGSEEKSVAIIRAILAMAQGLGLEVVAEGIEDEGQARLLKQFNCQYGQGYLYSRPLQEQNLLDFVLNKMDKTL